MKLIAIDTSGEKAHWTGVTEDGGLDPSSSASARRHDEQLSAGVREWLKRHDWTNKLDGVAVVNGPGGFTGLRVGVAFATGFAAALKLPVALISTYELLAARAEEGANVWALAYGGREDIRSRLMLGGPDPRPVGEVLYSTIHDLRPPKEGMWIALGPGYERHTEVIESLLGERMVREARLLPEEEALALAVQAVWNSRGGVAPADVDIDYGAQFRPTMKKRD